MNLAKSSIYGWWNPGFSPEFCTVSSLVAQVFPMKSWWLSPAGAGYGDGLPRWSTSLWPWRVWSSSCWESWLAWPLGAPLVGAAVARSRRAAGASGPPTKSRVLANRSRITRYWRERWVVWPSNFFWCLPFQTSGAAGHDTASCSHVNLVHVLVQSSTSAKSFQTYIFLTHRTAAYTCSCYSLSLCFKAT